MQYITPKILQNRNFVKSTVNFFQLSESFDFRNHVFNSPIVYGSAGKHANNDARLNIEKTPIQFNQDFIGPTKSYPEIEPKPAIPSLIPDIVASAFYFFNTT